ncbi:hypothetical protein [Leptolyngbya sp. CCY15150]|nr:hypothetical protein [Leptolyngbya sp. CCY15150]
MANDDSDYHVIGLALYAQPSMPGLVCSAQWGCQCACVIQRYKM